MNRTILTIGTALLVAAPTAALAQKPPKDPKPAPTPGTTGLTIAAAPNPVVFGGTVTISGKLSGTNSGARALRVEADPFPYGDGFAQVATPTTANNGNYSVALKPSRNTRYRTIATGTPAAASPELVVSVRRRVGLTVSDSTPARGSLVRFSGSVLPESDGKSVLVQRRSSTGSWSTIARTTARDAGSDLSRYSIRVRIYRTAAYRVKVVGDAVLVNGFSTVRTLTIH